MFASFRNRKSTRQADAEEKKDDDFADIVTITEGKTKSTQPNRRSSMASSFRDHQSPVGKGPEKRTRFAPPEDMLEYESVASPMARMRDVDVQNSSTLEEKKRSAIVYKSHDEVKAEKQRKWKRQMKLAQKKKRAERRALDANSGSDILNGKGLMGLMLSGVQRNECFHLVQYQCGRLHDTSSDSSESSFPSGEESSEVDSRSSGGSNRVRTSRRSARRSRSSSKNREKADQEIKSYRHQLDDENSTSPNRIHPGSDHAASESPILYHDISTPVSMHRTKISVVNPNLSSAHPPSREDTERCSDTTDFWSAASGASSANIDPRNKRFVRAFVNDMVTTGFPMLWHKEQCSINPSTMVLKIKMGYKTPSLSYCGPRLVWDDKDDFVSYGFSLCDIRSLEGADARHLKDYPFAIPGRTVLLKLTRRRDFIFEAKSEEEAKRFVHGMRWATARFSFNLIIGNLGVSSELLDLGGGSAPGSLLEEAECARAMDDVTEQFVEKSVFY